MDLKLTMNLDNASFDAGPDGKYGSMVGDGLRNIANYLDSRILGNGDGAPIMDADGNRVGQWTIES